MKRLILLATGIALPSCGMPGAGSHTLPPHTVGQISIEIARIDETARAQGWTPGKRAQEIDSAFVKRGVSREDYRKTIDWMNEDPVRWKDVGEELVRTGGGPPPPPVVR
jgi:hypothetical protein